MNMRKTRCDASPSSTEGGQVLIMVAVAMVMLVAFLALAVDMGHAYSERRHMQNAADAAALAGAWEICFGDPALAASTAYDYATTRNGAQTAQVQIQNSYTVTVVAQETINTAFARIVGYPTTDVAAVAAASCGQARSAAGLWPIAFYKPTWDALVCDEEFYVWNDDKEPECGVVYDCDLDGDGDDDIVGGGDRAWMDFSDVVVDPYTDPCVAPGCGESELECHISSGEASLIELPKCIPGTTGVKAGVKDDVQNRAGDSVNIPLYESVDVCDTAVSCPGANRYYVTNFGCVQVVEWDQSVKLVALDGTGVYMGKAIKVFVDCSGACASSQGGTNGLPPIPGGVNAVSLIR